ncbi:MAG: nuclear transport factor 2 family protein [Chitinophagaceae bacterium]|jgi:ketosteroid isomerase-like protein|nr:nuclear transport factor 2 family protein [Chitinophagaceae bacterium]MBK8299320.1 nuclear transport factor 2 family protein [Chitinophagaceae bacterium]MBK9463370.1 nuclear transport factor 2 family protein [Chitinophagaceae bacterium]MBK9661280.1 nuclear transport factor 2 family protein [Chitinophagaceae bacterium]MBP6233399.1 nuclear transport factor 2 family protein [Chitinophagaceae bacterium]
MQKKCTIIFFIITVVLLTSCQSGNTGEKQEKAKKEIQAAEKEFEKMAAEKGIAEAFWYFADSSAVIRGANDSLILGKEGIRNFFSADRFKTATVRWSPDFIDAAESGEMGYTYGKYTWQSKDSTGKVNESRGVFHTVWKKQQDGNWKFVWD